MARGETQDIESGDVQDASAVLGEQTQTEAAPAEGTAETAPAAPPKKQKDPIPEGYVAPVQFAHELDKHLGQPDGTTRPQVIYGYVRNSKDFPSEEREGQFPRFIVHLAKGLEWWDAKETRKAEREAAKKAKEAAAATAQAQPATTEGSEQPAEATS